MFFSWRNAVRWRWPREESLKVAVPAGTVMLRRATRGDGQEVAASRLRSARELAQWEPDNNFPVAVDEREALRQWRVVFRWGEREARAGTVVPLVVVLDGRVVGQVLLSQIEQGAVSSATLGYWVDSGVVGQGVGTAAAALGVDWALQKVGVRRVQATVHGDNEASRKVLERVGMRREGVLRKYMCIGGRFLSHELWALVAEDVPEGAVAKLVHNGRLRYM